MSLSGTPPGAVARSARERKGRLPPSARIERPEKRERRARHGLVAQPRGQAMQQLAPAESASHGQPSAPRATTRGAGAERMIIVELPSRPGPGPDFILYGA
jgi:hypothetical protein